MPDVSDGVTQLPQSPDTPHGDRADPLDTHAELTARVDAIWAEWRRIEHEERPLVAQELIKGALHTALIRAQRDAARRTLDFMKAAIEEIGA